ncbi:MAG: leucyl aminopeptidase [Colwellia sp.]|jgi:leucyl aminopeptidase
MTDYTNDAQNTFMTQPIDTYLSDISYGFDQCDYGCSDHTSWHNQDYPASMPLESKMLNINSSIHNANDSSFNSANALNFARISATFIRNDVAVTVNATAKEQTKCTFEVPADATSLNFQTNGGSGNADLYI